MLGAVGTAVSRGSSCAGAPGTLMPETCLARLQWPGRTFLSTPLPAASPSPLPKSACISSPFQITGCCTYLLNLPARRPSPLPPIPFFKSPPAKNQNGEERQGERAGRAVLRAWSGIQGVGTQSVRAMQFQDTTHAERAKWVRAECRIRSQVSERGRFRNGFLWPRAKKTTDFGARRALLIQQNDLLGRGGE